MTSLSISQSKWGMIIAAILIFFFLIVSAFFAYIKNNGAAWAFGSIGFIGIIGAFYRYIKIPIMGKKK